jgi:hypothetical protein
MDRVYESRDHGWLSIHGGLTTMGRCDRSGAREVVVIAQSSPIIRAVPARLVAH